MVLAILWTLIILAGLLAPGDYFPSGAFSFDKLIHFALFAGFAGLWMIALSGTLPRASLYVFLLGLAYGILTEVGQAMTDGGRSGDPYDALANTLGVLTGVAAYLAWRRLTPDDPAHRG